MSSPEDAPVGDDCGRESESEGTVIQVALGRVRLGPVGFLKYAEGYLEAVRLPAPGDPYTPVPYFLCCRSIELALKAFLLSRRVPVVDLQARSLGHDLVGVLHRARSEDLDTTSAITEEQLEQLRKAKEYYSKKGFEYFDRSRVVQGHPDLPNLYVLYELAHSLVRDLGPVCARASVAQRDRHVQPTEVDMDDESRGEQDNDVGEDEEFPSGIYLGIKETTVVVGGDKTAIEFDCEIAGSYIQRTRLAKGKESIPDVPTSIWFDRAEREEEDAEGARQGKDIGTLTYWDYIKCDLGDEPAHISGRITVSPSVFDRVLLNATQDDRRRELVLDVKSLTRQIAWGPLPHIWDVQKAPRIPVTGFKVILHSPDRHGNGAEKDEPVDDLAGFPEPEPAASKETACRWCTESIRKGAEACPHCGKYQRWPEIAASYVFLVFIIGVTVIVGKELIHLASRFDIQPTTLWAVWVLFWKRFALITAIGSVPFLLWALAHAYSPNLLGYWVQREDELRWPRREYVAGYSILVVGFLLLAVAYTLVEWLIHRLSRLL